MYGEVAYIMGTGWRASDALFPIGNKVSVFFVLDCLVPHWQGKGLDKLYYSSHGGLDPGAVFLSRLPLRCGMLRPKIT